MAIALVQSAEGISASATTTAAFSVAPTSGNLVVLCFASDDYNGTPNTGWTQSSEMEQQTFHGGYIWWRISDGSNSLQYTIGSATNSAWILLEFSGVDATPYDTSQGAFTQSGGTTRATDTITPTTGGRVLVAMMGASRAGDMSAVTGSWNNSFTHVRDVGNSTGATRDWVAASYRLVTGDGSTGYTTTGTHSGTSSDARSALIISFKEGASANKTITAAGGTYTVTGTAASLERGREVAADGGSYAISGTAASLELGREVLAGGGSYALTGTDATFDRTYVLTALGGSYSISGTAASLELGREVAADSGTYAITGTAASLELGREVAADGGTYAITGTAASLEFGREVAADSGSYAITGADATLTKSTAGAYTITADGGSYSISGTAATLLHGWEVAADGGTYSITGSAATLTEGQKIAADGGSYAISGTAATISRTYEVTADSASYSITGTAATLGINLEAGQPTRDRTDAWGPKHARIFRVIGLEEEEEVPPPTPKRRKAVAQAVVREIQTSGLLEQAFKATPAVRQFVRQEVARVYQPNMEWVEMQRAFDRLVQNAAEEAARIEQEIEDEDEFILLLAS